MGGCSCDHDDYEFISPRTLVLVGKTGTGKSATGNSILGMKILLSKRSSSGVTVSSELQTVTTEDGQWLNVIDTPGLFDPSLNFELIGKEIVKCISMAPDGIDAFLVVVSTFTRFSEEEKVAISSLETLFGREVYDYMIVVFTGGDGLEEDDQTLQDFLSDSPESLKEVLSLCGNRCLLFDNKTKDEMKRTNQVNNLLFLVNLVSKNNGGKAYTNDIFTEVKNQREDLKEQEIVSLDDERFKHIQDMVETKLKETALKFEKQLAEEKAARVKAEEKAKAVEKKICEEKRKLKETTEKSEKMKLKETTSKFEKQLAEERAARLKAEEKAKAVEKKIGEEKRKLKETTEKSEKLKKEIKKQKEELQRKEAHLRQKDEDLRRAAGGCFIL